ncbi:MAG: superinfection immunity protein [Chloroflexota bacterium]
MFPFRLGLWGLLLVLPTLAVYFAPTIVAITRRAKNISGIVLLNIFGGWTFVGWVISLVWAIIDPKQTRQ